MPEGFKIASAYVSVSPDTTGFREEAQDKLDEAMAGVRANAKVGLDQQDLDAGIDEARRKVADLDGERAEPKLSADIEQLRAAFDEADAKLDELDGKRADPEIGANDDDFTAKADDARAKLDDLDGKHAEPEIGASDADFEAKVRLANAQLDALSARSARPRIGASVGGAAEGDVGAAAEGDLGMAAEGGAGSGLLGGGFPGGMLTALAGGITAIMPGIGGATAGLGLLGGTGVAALGGVGKALSAHDQASQNVGLTQAQLAATAFSNAVQIQQAQQAVSQAYRTAAENAVMSAEQTESAQGQLAMTVRNAGMAQQQAIQAVVQAEQQEQQANFSLAQAQYNLSDAWIQARYNLQQLNDEERNQATTMAAARLAVAQAQYQQKLTDQNAMSTSLDRQQAAIAVAQAQEQLTSAQQQGTYVSQEAALQDKYGVAGSQQVQAAKEAVKVALFGVRDAMKQVALAEKQLAITEKNDAEEIKLAMLAVKEAEQQAAFQRKEDAIAIQQASQNVINIEKEQRLQMEATLSTSNQAANQFAKDMSRLTAPARQFVNELLSMHGAWRQIEAIAQGTVLPGMMVFLRGVKSILPEIDTGVRLMGRAMGQSFASFGRLMQTPAFREGLAGLLRNGVQFANTVLPAFARFLQMMGQIGGRKGAVTGLANILAGIANGLSAVLRGVAPFSSALNSVLTTLGQALVPLGTVFGQLIGSLATGLAPVLKALLPGFTTLATSLGSALVTTLRALGIVLTPVATMLSRVVIALAPLLPAMAQMVMRIAQGLTPGLIALTPLVVQIAQLLSQELMISINQTLDSIMPLIPAIVKLIISLTPIIELVLRITSVLMTWSAKITGPVLSAIAHLEAAAITLASKWQDAFKLIESAALWMWHNVFDPMWHGIEIGAHAFVHAFSVAWGKLETIFKTPVNFLIGTVYDKGIARLWNDVVGAIGLGSLKLPVIPQMAAGGIVPGQDRGVDSKLVMMRPGEGVLTPGAVQAIGPGTVHSLNAQYSGSSGSSGSSGGHGGGKAGKEAGRAGRRVGEHLLGFGSGGILGDLGGWITGIGRKIIGGAKWLAELATNPTAAITSLLSHVIGTDATGNMRKIMLGIPKELIKDLATAIGLGGGVGVSVPGHPSGTVQSWFKKAVGLTKTPVSWMPDLETIAYYESGDNPNAINLSDTNAAAGDPSRGLMQTIMSTFLGYHQAGTSMNIYDPVANIAAAIRYIKSRYGTVGNVPGIVSLAHGGKYVGYDTGGWLLPGGTMPVNQTGRPEAVLTPQQSDALVSLAQRAEAAGGAGQPVVNFQYFGTQYPTAEQRALMNRDLALALSGAS